MTFFGVFDLLTSLFTCLPGVRHYKERQGKVTEVLSSHSKKGHAHNSGKQLPNLSHLRRHLWAYLFVPHTIPFWLKAWIATWKRLPEKRPSGPLGSTWGEWWYCLSDGIVCENSPGWGPDISFLFLTQTWHTCSVEPSWTTSLTWCIQKDACPCSSLNMAENCTWKDPRFPLLWKSCLILFVLCETPYQRKGLKWINLKKSKAEMSYISGTHNASWHVYLMVFECIRKGKATGLISLKTINPS